MEIKIKLNAKFLCHLMYVILGAGSALAFTLAIFFRLFGIFDGYVKIVGIIFAMVFAGGSTIAVTAAVAYVIMAHFPLVEKPKCKQPEGENNADKASQEQKEDNRV